MPLWVIPLRNKGQKIPVEQLREIEPLVGRPVVELKASGDSRTFRMIAQLRGPGLGDIADVCWPAVRPGAGAPRFPWPDPRGLSA